MLSYIISVIIILCPHYHHVDTCATTQVFYESPSGAVTQIDEYNTCLSDMNYFDYHNNQLFENAHQHMVDADTDGFIPIIVDTHY